MLLLIAILLIPIAILVWLFFRSKTRTWKWIFAITTLVVVAFETVIYLSLVGMEVEDLYGDKSEIYWQAKQGDTLKIIDRETKEILATSILKKTWDKIHVISNRNEIDLNKWLKQELGDSFAETRIEFKPKEVEIFIPYKKKEYYFMMGNYTENYGLRIFRQNTSAITYSFGGTRNKKSFNEVGKANRYATVADSTIYRSVNKTDTLNILIWKAGREYYAKVYKIVGSKKTVYEGLHEK